MKCLKKAWPLGVCLPLMTGCMSVNDKFVKDGRDVAVAPIKAPTTAAKTVKTGGACFDLGEGHQAAYSPEEFVGKVNDLLASGRQASAQHLVSLYPDLCQESLRRVTNAEAASSAVQLIAKTHDIQVDLSDSPLSWAGLMKERASNPVIFTNYDAARKQALENKSVTTAGLVKLAPHPLLLIDALRLTGDALMLAEQPDKAAVEFVAAIKLTQNNYAYQTVQLELALGEAYRRSGQIEQAVGMWQQAALSAGRLAASGAPVADPILWELASALRPANTAWPDPVVTAVIPASAVRRSAGSDEAHLWKRVGQWRLDRGEPQAALLAFKRAESMCMEPSVQEDLQLQQASALMQLGQSAAAAAILTPLVEKPRPTVQAAALAMLGSMKLQVGAVPQATTLLKKSFEVAQSANWPGRAEAEADLGLACLMTNDAAAGLESLHTAQKRFKASGNMLMLRQSLQNEITYWKRIGNANEVTRLQSQLDGVEGNVVRVSASSNSR